MMDPKILNIKSEGLTVIPHLCAACCSIDRQLTPIGDLAETFCSLLNDRYFHMNKTPILVCWECKAIFRNIKLMKIKMNLVQDYLNSGYNGFKHATMSPQTRLAKSSVNHDLIIMHYDETPIFEPKIELDEPKIDLHKKKLLQIPEPKIDTDSLLFDMKSENEDWEIPNDILPTLSDVRSTKKRVKLKTKQKLPKSKLKFKLINGDCKKEKGVSQYTKIKMSYTELGYWLERDKKDESFLKWPFRCESCVWGTSREKSLNKHNRKHHCETIGQFSCEICSSRLSTKMALVTHIIHHYYIRQCNVCGYKCCMKTNMLGHIKKYHERTYKCLKCGLCYHNTKVFYKHYKEMHSRFICNECGKVCHSKTAIKHHLVNKHGPHECKMCKKTFKSRRARLAHSHATFDDPELAYCVECDKQLDSVKAFKRHLQSSKAHANDTQWNRHKEIRIPCPDCDKVYKRKSYMMNHYRHVHLKESRFYCEDCDKYFLNRTRYIDHRRFQHEGFKPEKNKLCSVCGRGFSTNRILEKHMRTHTGERPFECTFCDAKFTQKESMQSHVKHIHMKVKRQNSTPKFFQKYEDGADSRLRV